MIFGPCRRICKTWKAHNWLNYWIYKCHNISTRHFRQEGSTLSLIIYTKFCILPTKRSFHWKWPPSLLPLFVYRKCYSPPNFAYYPLGGAFTGIKFYLIVEIWVIFHGKIPGFLRKQLNHVKLGFFFHFWQ